VVEEVCSGIAPLAEKKGITVTTALSPVLRTVSLDQQKLRQILYNLLSNAVKFTNKGGRVEVAADRTPDGRLCIHLKDTGIGIKAEDFGKLFTEFQQLGSAQDRHYQGTGLGLALTRKIVEIQNGTIGVESAVGKGSTFTVVLPIAEER